jgi:hypothetical protein
LHAVSSRLQRCPTQIWLGGHSPLQTPPQPSGAPSHLPTQLVRQHRWETHASLPGHAPVQVPPQPSGAPPHFPAQLGVQTQVCVVASQTSGAWQHWLPQHSSPELVQPAQGSHVPWLGSAQRSVAAQQLVPQAWPPGQHVLDRLLTHTSPAPQHLLPHTEAQQVPSDMQVSVEAQHIPDPQGLKVGEQQRPIVPTQVSATSQHSDPPHPTGQHGPPPAAPPNTATWQPVWSAMK